MSELTSHHKKRYGDWAGNPGGNPPDPARCAEEVRSGWRYTQCARKRGSGPEGAYCKQHDPERIAKKEAERRAKSEAESRARIRRWAREAFVPRLEQALREIAAGHNDPRSLAAELLAEYDKL